MEIIFKCTDCGNTFRKDRAVQDEVVTCPICEAQYKVVASTNGKFRLKDFVFDESDFGEL